MKNVFKFMAVAAIASLTMVACNNNNTEATDTIDTTAAIEQIAEDEMVAEPAEVLDTTPVVEEQQAPAKSTKTQATKKTAAAPTAAKVEDNGNTTIEKNIPAVNSDKPAEAKKVTSVKRKSAKN